MKNYKIKIKNFPKILFFLFLATFIFVSVFPYLTNAALVPCGRSDQGGEMCTLCHLIIGIYGIIKYGFSILSIIGILMIVIAAVVYIVSAGNTEMMNVAKGLLKNALIGFSIVISAWLIVNTAMWVIGTKESDDKEGALGLGIKVESWNKFRCDSASSANSNSGK